MVCFLASLAICTTLAKINALLRQDELIFLSETLHFARCEIVLSITRIVSLETLEVQLHSEY
jgi:hypothetical protein